MAETNDPNAPMVRVNWIRLALSWLWVGIPLAWGVFQTAQRSLALFR